MICLQGLLKDWDQICDELGSPRRTYPIVFWSMFANAFSEKCYSHTEDRGWFWLHPVQIKSLSKSAEEIEYRFVWLKLSCAALISSMLWRCFINLSEQSRIIFMPRWRRRVMLVYLAIRGLSRVLCLCIIKSRVGNRAGQSDFTTRVRLRFLGPGRVWT